MLPGDSNTGSDTDSNAHPSAGIYTHGDAHAHSNPNT